MAVVQYCSKQHSERLSQTYNWNQCTTEISYWTVITLVPICYVNHHWKEFWNVHLYTRVAYPSKQAVSVIYIHPVKIQILFSSSWWCSSLQKRASQQSGPGKMGLILPTVSWQWPWMVGYRTGNSGKVFPRPSLSFRSFTQLDPQPTVVLHTQPCFSLVHQGLDDSFPAPIKLIGISLLYDKNHIKI